MELRDRIIAEASRMFSREGIKSVRMDDIALACGISKRTLYETFLDREDLIRQTMRYHINTFEASVAEKLRSAKNVIDEFWIMFSSGVQLRDLNRLAMLDMTKYYPKIFDEFIEKHHKNFIECNRRRFEQGVREGLILEWIDTAIIARILSSYIYGLQRDFEDVLSGQELDENGSRTLQLSVMLFFRGITTEKGRRYIDENILNI